MANVSYTLNNISGGSLTYQGVTITNSSSYTPPSPDLQAAFASDPGVVSDTIMQNLTVTVGSNTFTGTPAVQVLAAAAIALNNVPVTYVTGSGAALNATPFAALDVSQYKTMIVNITGTFNATATWEGSEDNSTWRTIQALGDLANTPTLVQLEPTVIAPSTVIVPVISKYARLRISTYTSGTMSITSMLTATDISEIYSLNTLSTIYSDMLLSPGISTSGQFGPFVQGAATTSAPSYSTATFNPLSMDTSGNLRIVDKSDVAQASSTSGQVGPLVQGAVTTAAPSYSTSQTDPLSLTTAGQLRVTDTSIAGPVSAGTAASNAALVGLVYNSSLPAPTTGQQVALQANAFGELAVVFRNKFKNLAGAATTTVKSGAGRLHTITINNVAVAATATVFDNTAGSGTVIATITSTTATVNQSTLIFDCEFATGLTVVTTGTSANFTVTYQ